MVSDRPSCFPGYIFGACSQARRNGSADTRLTIEPDQSLTMPRFKLTIEYAGTRYSGWQIQQNAKTVQGEINRALGDALGKAPFETYGSGRTDAGVHALGQVAHLDT